MMVYKYILRFVDFIISDEKILIVKENLLSDGNQLYDNTILF